MNDLRRTLEREMERIPPPDYPIASVERRRRRRRRSQRFGTIVTALVIAALGIGFIARAMPGGGPQPADGTPGRLVFVAPGGGAASDRLFTSAPDGSGRERVADVHAEYPDWAPDGTAIAFGSGQNLNGSPIPRPNGHIVIVRADGSDLREVPFNGAASAPSWSPDGSRLAVAARRGETHPGIGWLDPATGALTWLTRNPFAGFWDAEPDVSPDGSRIVFVRVRELQELGGTRNLAALFVVGADGTGLRRLTSWATDAGTPAWSPDGTRIAFDSADHAVGSAGGRETRIELIRADGSNRVVLDQPAYSAAYWPTWSPDGSRLVFTGLPVEGGPVELASVSAIGDAAASLPIRVDGNQADWGRR